MKKRAFVVFYVNQLAHLLVCLVSWETMAVKNFLYRENWVGIRVAAMQTNVFDILTQPGPTFWPQKAQIRNCLNTI